MYYFLFTSIKKYKNFVLLIFFGAFLLTNMPKSSVYYFSSLVLKQIYLYYITNFVFLK